MCGITGFLTLDNRENEENLRNIIEDMSNVIWHRGPNSSGAWIDAEAGIAFGHRRLSIVDLSPMGAQPMESNSGRFIIVFNGEIYNFNVLRNQLMEELSGSSFKFRGHSDTEVMLAAFERWGVENAVQRFVGMFAFALWDKKERKIFLVRDRMGEKPLYYGWFGTTLLFGSELKSLKAHPHFKQEIDRNALALYLRHNYIPTPYSIYKGVHKLKPGTILTIDVQNPNREMAPSPYWSLKNTAEVGVHNQFSGTDADAINELETLLKNSVKAQMVADVPIGAFLSGGIDSSTIVALMQSISNRPINTFTIGFSEEAFNEAVHAEKIAQYLGTNHTQLYVTPEQAMNVIPKLPNLYDEPFSDSSQIPTYLVSELARKHVTVSLSGDGGDELFGGYNRYFLSESIWNKIGWIPKILRNSAAATLTSVSTSNWDRLNSFLSPVMRGRLKFQRLGDKVHKLSEVFSFESAESLYHGLVSHWKEPTNVVQGSIEPLTILTDQKQWANLPNFQQRMMYLDMLTYLPDDILVKVDRASMGVSLESRIPLLDHRIIEFAWKVPLSMKIREGRGKWILRQVLNKYLPKELIERPKMGFGVPIADWLRGPLKEWADDLLDYRRLKEDGFFNPEPILNKWQEHTENNRNWQYYLWDILMFQAWLKNN